MGETKYVFKEIEERWVKINGLGDELEVSNFERKVLIIFGQKQRYLLILICFPLSSTFGTIFDHCNPHKNCFITMHKMSTRLIDFLVRVKLEVVHESLYPTKPYRGHCFVLVLVQEGF